MALPALMEEMVEEILLRLPPEEPAHLFRAAMACKAWFRILSDGGFRRRYCRFHQTPILLGYICSDASFMGAGAQFVPTTSFSPPPLPNSCYHRLLDCRHGRVLINNVDASDDSPAGFIVWDLITGNGQHLGFPAYGDLCSSNGAVLCARHRHGCDHFNCHGGPFLVVFVGTHVEAMEHDVKYTWASVYSSETGAWSAQTPCSNTNYYHAGGLWNSSLLIGDTLYFTLASFEIRILKYDLGGHALSLIEDTPEVFRLYAPIDIDGELGIIKCDCDCIYTWSWQVNANGVGEWVKQKVAELETFLTMQDFYSPDNGDTIRFVEGTDIVLLCLHYMGVFTLDLKSRKLRKVKE